MASQRTLSLLALGATTLLGASALAWQRSERQPQGLPVRSDTARQAAAARGLDRGAALLALAVAADSALEHYRGGFHNRAMYTPLLLSTLALLASGSEPADPAPQTQRLRRAIYLGAGAAGLAGTGFHLYNVCKRPGGWSWSNLFYAAPLGAPSALLLCGVLGYYAERVRAPAAGGPPMFGLPAGRAVALLAAVGLLGTSAEVALLHFRGSFQNPAMYLPVSAPPLSAALLAASAVADPRRSRLRWLSRLSLRFTACMGLAGAAFHALGIARNHGGWRNWRQNLLAGPPLPAPPSFTGLALAGLAAHRLLENGIAPSNQR